MSQSHPDIKLEPGVAASSLGALLASYGDSSDSEIDDDQTFGDLSETTPAEAVARLVAAIKQEALESEEVDRKPPLNFGDGVVVKKEKDDGTTPIVKREKENVTTPVVKKEKEGGVVEDCALDVEDFLAKNLSSYTTARPVKVEVESDSGTSDTEEDSSDTHESEYEDCAAGGADLDSKKKSSGPKVKGEFGLADLPPIEDLHISVPHDDCKPIGVIKSVVEPLVLVDAYPNTPALNIDSVLFLEEGDRAMGQIFDVIGPVKQPIYCVRFNSKEHIEKNKIAVGMSVYCAPKTKYTSYVFLAQLQKLKGSDASWVNDVEPPTEEVDFSDDEMERFAKKKKRNRKRFQAEATEEDATYKDESGGENRHRGKKRQHDSNAQRERANRSPFIPPMIPGFMPGFDQGNYRFYPPHDPRFRFPQNFRGGPPHWFRGQRDSHRFRPFVPHTPRFASGSLENSNPQPSQRPWCPPLRWQHRLPVNYRFGDPNSHPIPQPQPPPPPPPPPPGS